MLQKIEMKYKAFLSYSHKDTKHARRLHKRLEHFKIDKDLRGRETARGAVPNSLRPIFRDRDDFTAGHTLTDQTLAALDASPALIVICSPNSAQSHYVNEEIRLFKSRHPDRPVIPVIVAGEPSSPSPHSRLANGERGRVLPSRSAFRAKPGGRNNRHPHRGAGRRYPRNR